MVSENEDDQTRSEKKQVARGCGSKTKYGERSSSSSIQVVGSGYLKPLDLKTTNMAVAWKNWITQLKIYLRANNLEEECDSRKVAILLHFIGPESLVIFYAFNVDIDKIKFDDLIEKFTNHFTPQVNITMERHKLFNRRQGVEETIDDYVTDLKNIGRQCDFLELEDSLMRDVFSWNLNSANQYIKQKILERKPRTFDEAIQLARCLDTTKIQAKTLEDAAVIISPVHTQKQYRQNKDQTKQSNGTKQSSNTKRTDQSSTRKSRDNSKSPKKQVDTCHRCSQVHRYKCPAIGVKCKKCGKYNHYAVACRNKQVNCIDRSENNSLFMGLIRINNIKSDSWCANLSVNNVNINFLLDTGADTNVISSKTFNNLKVSSDSITKSIYKLSTYSGQTIPTIGQCYLPLSHNGQTYNVLFHIVDIDSQNILGRDTCSSLKLIKRIYNVQIKASDNIIADNSGLFQGLGCLKNFTCDIKLKPDATPSIDACRRVPFQLKNKLKAVLDELVKTNVICPVNEPTEWVSSLVLTTKKDGKLRLCLDPRKLNKAIMRPHFQFPTLDEIKSDLSGARFFTTLDANKGFWMLKLSDSASKLCTFITPFGRYRYTRLPYGISAAPEIFYREMVNRFSDIKNVKIMMDDFLIYGSTIEEHDVALQNVLNRAREINLKFNKDKSVICTSEVKYLGHIFSSKGVLVDQSKVKAICDMPSPSCINDLQRFMGMVNYLSSFIPNLSKENSLLRTLLSKKVEWSWTEHHEAEFNKIKKLISSAPVLSYFDPNKDITMSVDASKDALGAVILHDKQPIAYASASLTKCQQNYSQIEKELLSILFGCTKFHQYIYGRLVTVETDHKPLITLFKKALVDIPARLQRIMLRLQPYDLNVIYKPGRYLYIADTLSRAALCENTLQDLDKDLDLHVNFIISYLSASKEKLSQLQDSTSKDPILTQIIGFCQNGWPEHKRSVSQSIKPYFSLKDKLHVLNKILFLSEKIVIPESMREYVINLSHEGHQGMNSTMRLAQSTVYWPNMKNDIEKFVNNCHTCLTYRRSNSKEPIIHHEYKYLPWNKVGIDLFDVDNKKYLIVVDYYSKYVELALLNSGSNALTVITHLKSIFARHGIPEFIVSDNGPPFSSNEFKSFINEWNINHNTSSPYLSRSNGMVERAIGSIKNMLKKCKADKSDPYLALLAYRNTPKNTTGFSPTQLCMSRYLRTKMPVSDSQLSPTLVNIDTLKNNIEKHKSYSTLYYNKHSKSLPNIEEGDKVYFKKKPHSVWVPGTISKACSEPRSFVVKSPEGEFRRSREHILKPVVAPTAEVVPENKINISNKDENVEIPKNSPLQRSRSGRIIKNPTRYIENC